jgi:hypothetical protein
MSTLKRDSMEAVSELSTQIKSTILSTPTEQPQPRRTDRPNITTLPTPILNTIFSHLLDIELVNAGKDNVSYIHTLNSSGTLQFKASRSPFPVHTALFFVSKKISEIALRFFYARNLFIRFMIRTSDARHAKNMVTDSGVLFSVASADVLERMKLHAMDLILTEKDSAHTRAVVTFPAQYLPRLVNFMDQASKATSSWSASHKLELNVLNTYTFPISRLQGDLLEPFRFLSNFSSATITSKNLLPGYADGLQTSITSPFTATSWLSTIEAIADQGDNARAKADWEISRQHYHSAIISLTYAYLTHPEDLHSQNDHGEAFAKRVQRLRWRCELGVGQTLLSQHKFDRPHIKPATSSSAQNWASDPAMARELLTAETSLSAALSLSTNSSSPTSNPWIATLPVDLVPPNSESWFTNAESGECWYWLGLAHSALEEYLFAAGDMERAVRLLGGEGSKAKEVEEVFEWVRGRINWEVPPGRGLRRAAGVARRAE